MTSVFSLYRQAFSNLQKNVWILSTAMFINRSGSMVLLFASLYLTNELHFSISEAGIIMSFLGAGGILGSYAGGWLTDRKNYRDIMLFSLIASALILLLLLFVTNAILIATIIFCYSFAADMFRPANGAAIASFTSTQDRTRSISLVRLAANLGFSVGPAIGGMIALYLGYKWLFIIDSVTSLTAAIMLRIYLPRQQPDKIPRDHSVLKNSSTSAYRDWKYLVFILLVAAYGLCFFQIIATIPQFFSKQCNYHEDKIGWLLALNGFLVVLIEMPLITALQKKKNIFRFIIAGTLCIPVAFTMLLVGHCVLIWPVIYIVILTFSEIFAMPFMMNHALSQPLKERQGQYAALYSIAFGIALMTAPAVGLGIAGRFGFDTTFYFFSALSVVVAIGFALLKRKLDQDHKAS
ncbi:MAG: MFS transporter [Chitinophagales bacterium]